jgi:hypothetical protein
MLRDAMTEAGSGALTRGVVATPGACFASDGGGTSLGPGLNREAFSLWLPVVH